MVTAASTTTTLPTPAGPACTPKDLRATGGPGGAAGGHTVVRVLLTNHGADGCLLDGYPTVAGVGPDGSLVALNATDGTYTADPGLPGVIAPGETAAVDLEESWACEKALNGNKPQIWKTVELGLPAGGSIRVDAEVDSICGVAVSRFGVPTRQPPIEVTPSPSPLTLTLTAPATTHPGDTLAFTVTMTNPTATPYTLEPCPVYMEFLTTFTGANNDIPFATEYDYQLNCMQAPSIGAGASVTFQMALKVPADQPLGDAKFGWYVLGGIGPFTSAQMTVIAP